MQILLEIDFSSENQQSCQLLRYLDVTTNCAANYLVDAYYYG